MAVLATDNFNRANGAIGASWTSVEFTYDVVSNQAQASNEAIDSCVTNNTTVWPNDQYGQVTVFTLTASGDQTGIGIVLRCTDSANRFRVIVNAQASNNVSITKETTAGGYTLLAQRTQAFSDGDTLRGEIQGTTLRVYRNGVQLGADVAATGNATGNVGLMTSGPVSANAAVDDFEGGDLTAPASTGLAWIVA